MDVTQFKISKLLGMVYKKGNLVFPNNESFYSCIGNRIAFFDMALGKTQTLPVEGRYNFVRIAQSPNGKFMLAANEVGEVSLINLISMTVLNRKKFKPPINDIQFSPNGRYFVIARERNIFLYDFPRTSDREVNPFKLKKVFHPFHDEILSVDWSTDSQVIVVGGKDCQTRVIATTDLKNLGIYSFGGHTDHVIACFFAHESLSVFSFGRDGVVNVWECDTALEELIPGKPDLKQRVNYKTKHGKAPKKFKAKNNQGIFNESDNDSEEEEGTEKKSEEQLMNTLRKDDDTEKRNKIHYKRCAKFHLGLNDKDKKHTYLLSVDYHKKQELAILGFTNGNVKLYEVPNFDMIFTFCPFTELPIDSLKFDTTGYLIVFANERKGKLFVWNWKTKSVHLKQEGHFQNFTCLNYSNKGDKIITGDLEGKVSLWDTNTGYKIHSIDSHLGAPITGAMFAKQGTLVITSSNDGTVRVHETSFFKNFRTLTTEYSSKISCLACDTLGEFIAGAVEETYEIYVWNIKTGNTVAVLGSHSQEVNSMVFHPSTYEMVSTSGDKTIRVWNVFEKNTLKDTIDLNSEGLCVAYHSSGKQIAVSTLNGHIYFYDQTMGNQIGYIEGRLDLEGGRQDTDLISAKNSSRDLAFTALSFTTSGQHIIAGGRSKFICIYHVFSKVLVKKFSVTCNLSLDGMTDFINIRKMTEFGNIALVEEREDGSKTQIQLPGTRFGDMSSRSHKPQVRVTDIKFCPTERHWAATTTEGLVIFSLEQRDIFKPTRIDPSITPNSIHTALANKDYLNALVQALSLNETIYIREVILQTPSKCIVEVCKNIHDFHVERLSEFLVDEFKATLETGFILSWIEKLCLTKPNILNRKNLQMQALQKRTDYYMEKRVQLPQEINDRDNYMAEYLLMCGSIRVKGEEEQEAVMEEGSEDDSESDMEC